MSLYFLICQRCWALYLWWILHKRLSFNCRTESGSLWRSASKLSSRQTERRQRLPLPLFCRTALLLKKRKIPPLLRVTQLTQEKKKKYWMWEMITVLWCLLSFLFVSIYTCNSSSLGSVCHFYLCLHAQRHFLFASSMSVVYYKEHLCASYKSISLAHSATLWMQFANAAMQLSYRGRSSKASLSLWFIISFLLCCW